MILVVIVKINKNGSIVQLFNSTLSFITGKIHILEIVFS